MKIILNGEPRDVAEGLTLARLIEELSWVTGRLACEVNGGVVRRADTPGAVLKPNDVVEIVQMIGGG